MYNNQANDLIRDRVIDLLWDKIEEQECPDNILAQQLTTKSCGGGINVFQGAGKQTFKDRLDEAMGEDKYMFKREHGRIPKVGGKGRKLNEWQRFVKDHKGSGKSLKELSRMYKGKTGGKRKVKAKKKYHKDARAILRRRMRK